MKQITGCLNIDKESLTYPNFLMTLENVCGDIRDYYLRKVDESTVYTSFTIILRDGQFMIRKLPYH